MALPDLSNEPVVVNSSLTIVAAVATPLLAKYGIDAGGAQAIFSEIAAIATAVLSVWGVVRARSKVSPVAVLPAVPVQPTT